jgi:hypothetical protein
MRTITASIIALLWTVNCARADSAPTNVIGYVIAFDQSVVGNGTGRVTFDAHYMYLDDDPPREPYTYEKLGTNSFRVINFDPENPTVAWSHLLLTFTNANSGTMFDEDENQFTGTFQLFPPAPPTLSVSQSNSVSIVIQVNSLAGQIIVLEQSTNTPNWSPVATNIVWTGRWDLPQSVSGKSHAFFRAYVPTE